MSYEPDPGAVPVGTAFTRQLSQRDLSVQIPVNFVPVPGVVLTQACFANHRYDDTLVQKCFSNLLAVGFRRFEVDIYWDFTRRIWSLCPVQLGNPNGVPGKTTRSANVTLPRALHDLSLLDFVHANLLWPRQKTSRTRILTAPSTKTKPSGTTFASLASVSTITTLSPQAGTPTGPPALNPRHSPGAVVNLGQYSCTTSATFDLLMKIFASHLKATQTNVHAAMDYLIMNLHIAAPVTDPTSSSMSIRPEHLPSDDELLHLIVLNYTLEYLYTPQELGEQRADLNASGSWYGVVRSDEPDSAYFHVDGDGRSTSTPDGWPSESYVEMSRAKRLFAGFGHVDPPLQHYNFSGDASTIFPQDYLQSWTPSSKTSGGKMSSECFFSSDEYSVSSTNNSWALERSTRPPLAHSFGIKSMYPEAYDLMNCGYSPVLNTPLKNQTADQDFRPYLDYAQSTIWSWSDGQPRNRSTSEPKTQNRCAVLDSTSGYWQSEDCDNSHNSACRYLGQPYKWAISGAKVTYMEAGIACGEDTQFDAPRTSLENRYLLHAWRDSVNTQDLTDQLLWVNFNDLDVRACWVIGQNQTCPYVKHSGIKRGVVVPAVAAAIVFVVAMLTVFVKCAANRQTSKRRRRRRGNDGWDYEGVPS